MIVICNQNKLDGFGSQFQLIISAIIFSEIHKLEYIHTPIDRVRHNYDNDPLFLKKLNNAMNIDKKYRLITEIKKNEKKLKTRNYRIYKNFVDRYFELCYNSQSLKDIKKNYHANKKSKEHYLNKNIQHITIHIRRYNIQDISSPKNPRLVNGKDSRIYSNELLNIMKKINEKNEKNNIKHHFHIISQGTINDDEFKIYKIFDNLTFYLNESCEISFHRMVISDILVTSVSSYSYTAALLSDGIIYYKKFGDKGHKGAKKWIHF